MYAMEKLSRVGRVMPGHPKLRQSGTQTAEGRHTPLTGVTDILGVEVGWGAAATRTYWGHKAVARTSTGRGRDMNVKEPELRAVREPEVILQRPPAEAARRPKRPAARSGPPAEAARRPKRPAGGSGPPPEAARRPKLP
jgi:hypothetical protein